MERLCFLLIGNKRCCLPPALISLFYVGGPVGREGGHVELKVDIDVFVLYGTKNPRPPDEGLVFAAIFFAPFELILCGACARD